MKRQTIIVTLATAALLGVASASPAMAKDAHDGRHHTGYVQDVHWRGERHGRGHGTYRHDRGHHSDRHHRHTPYYHSGGWRAHDHAYYSRVPVYHSVYRGHDQTGWDFVIRYHLDD
jgi:hypothetical protein